MKPSAVVPQGANFSLIGDFGNCPLVARMIRRARDSGAPRVDFGAQTGPPVRSRRPGEP
jgi:hypothetical protein